MNVLDIVNRTMACLQRLPKREVRPKSATTYRRTLERMMREKVLDALRPGDARDTYNLRRAALHYGARGLLMDHLERCLDAVERHELVVAQRHAGMLREALDRIEPALALDPPLPLGASAWDMPPSRWQDGTERPRRGRNSKRYTLKWLPEDWTERLWNAVPDGWPYRDPLAIHLLAPCRPEEIVPGVRAHGWSPGVHVNLASPRSLEVTVAPVKARGTESDTPHITTISYDPTVGPGPARYLAALCSAAGGHLVVSMAGTNPMRKALGRLGRAVFPELQGVVISAYVCKHQLLADLKATVGAGGEVASAAGHITDRTQAGYGRVEYGRRLKGFNWAKSSRPPATSNVARAHALGKVRRQQSIFDTKPDNEKVVRPLDPVSYLQPR